ncbi:MAG: gamma carbonic anhydrase family protein [Oscillospiraceae bacterium]|nr:gamma carbonic anhydrase family protein [Oscillospiraceae bacterium]
MIKEFRGKMPEIGENCFIAETATIIGDVKIGANSSVWYGAVIRGDDAPIVIGERCNVQDNAVLHCAEFWPLTIGNGVTIGHNAIVHSANVKDNALIGMGAIVMNLAEIGENAIVGAGAVCVEDTVVPEGGVAVGCPAKVIRVDIENNTSSNELNAFAYTEMASEYLAERAAKEGK